MNRSDSIAALAGALAKAQNSLSNPIKNAVNPHFKSKFADLPTCLDTVRPSLAANGLSLIQFASLQEGGFVAVETILLHESGEWIGDVLALPATKDDPQGVGSAITYGRRYALCALLGVAGDEDDDANDASSGSKRPSGPPPTSGASRVASRLGTPPAAPAARQQPSTQGDVPDTLGRIMGDELRISLNEIGLDLDRLRESLGAVEKYRGLFDSVDPADWDLSLKEPIARWLQKARDAKAAAKAPAKPRVTPPAARTPARQPEGDGEPTL